MKILSFIGTSIDPRLLDSWQTVVDYLLTLFTFQTMQISLFSLHFLGLEKRMQWEAVPNS